MKVIVVDDHNLVAVALGELVKAAGLELVGIAHDGTEAVKLAFDLKPDLVIMDVYMPGAKTGFSAAREIRVNRPATKVLFVSMYDDEQYIRNAIDAGAAGYLLKDAPVAELMDGFKAIARGSSVLAGRATKALMDAYRAGRPTKIQTLSERESEVFRLTAEGLSCKEIATVLKIAPKTVEVHKYNSMKKLDLHNRSQVIRYAVAHKIVRFDEPALPREFFNDVPPLSEPAEAKQG